MTAVETKSFYYSDRSRAGTVETKSFHYSFQERSTLKTCRKCLRQKRFPWNGWNPKELPLVF